MTNITKTTVGIGIAGAIVGGVIAILPTKTLKEIYTYSIVNKELCISQKDESCFTVNEGQELIKEYDKELKDLKLEKKDLILKNVSSKNLVELLNNRNTEN